MQSDLDIDVYFTRPQLEYLLELVTESDLNEGPLISVDILAILQEAYTELLEAQNHLDRGLYES